MPYPFAAPLPDDIQPRGKQMRASDPGLPATRSLAVHILRELRQVKCGYTREDLNALCALIHDQLLARGYSRQNATILLSAAQIMSDTVWPTYCTIERMPHSVQKPERAVRSPKIRKYRPRNL